MWGVCHSKVGFGEKTIDLMYNANILPKIAVGRGLKRCYTYVIISYQLPVPSYQLRGIR